MALKGTDYKSPENKGWALEVEKILKEYEKRIFKLEQENKRLSTVVERGN